jgi:putative ABC transport system permease protein
LRQNLLRLPQVANASISSGMPAANSFGDTYTPEANNENKTGAESNIDLSSFMVDEAFIPTLKFKLLAGRAFGKDFADSASVILNETAVKQIGWKDPIGKMLYYPGNNQRFKVIGVVGDFNTESLHSGISSFALFYNASKTYNIRSSYIAVRIKPGNYDQAINNITHEWKAIAPNLPIEYTFMDAAFDRLYHADQTIGKVFTVFTCLSLTVACLGLLGLAMFTAERRTKEIGIRKVLGASVKSVVSMLSKDFLKLVSLSSLIAFPIAWYAMNKWLQDFAFPTVISWWVFVLAGGATLVIAILTVSFQSLKAALTNPVKCLRSE